MTETHTHPQNTDQARAVSEHPHAENEAAPSAAQRTLGKNRFRFLYRELAGAGLQRPVAGVSAHAAG